MKAEYIIAETHWPAKLNAMFNFSIDCIQSRYSM